MLQQLLGTQGKFERNAFEQRNQRRHRGFVTPGEKALGGTEPDPGIGIIEQFLHGQALLRRTRPSHHHGARGALGRRLGMQSGQQSRISFARLNAQKR